MERKLFLWLIVYAMLISSIKWTHFRSSISYILLLSRFLLQGFKSLQRWLHSSSSEEDDFSELGPAVTQGVGTLLKLSTEKREPFMVRLIMVLTDDLFICTSRLNVCFNIYFKLCMFTYLFIFG